ncbi:MAG: aldo/keto reductase [Lentisphaerae bacterium]|nr:aldo/keto reductase [Lentisphaerota bacterium]
MTYRRCGRSGLRLPALALGFWQNFGEVDVFDHARAMVVKAFDLGITHVDLANTYGPPMGAAEETFGRILRRDLAGHRDELIIATKAGFTMWPGPYGDWGSRKHVVSSLDQSLRRLGVDYVDIFYHHRPDPETPIEETMGALSHLVRQGKALYVGISNYRPEAARRAIALLREAGTPCLIHQPVYSLFNRWVEDGLLDLIAAEGVGCMAFSPLAQGLLTDRYLDGIPAGSRATKAHSWLRREDVTPARVEAARALRDMARARGQSLPQLALAWVLRRPDVTSALIGASRAEQIVENVGALAMTSFSDAELAAIDAICAPVLIKPGK